MASRFVNLAVKHRNGGQVPFSIHRINPADLFHPTGSQVPKQGSAEVVEPEKFQLPPATIAFDHSPRQPRSMDFLAFSANRDNIVTVDYLGCSYLYDALERSINTNMPMMQPIMQPMSVALGDRGLLVMSKTDHQFVALNDGCHPNSRYLSPLPNWYWQSLEPPPFPSRSYKDQQNWNVSHNPYEISSYTLVGDAQFWVSTVCASTFCFDIRSGKWNKAGNWVLPFRGRAEYVPEHNLWFGLFGKDGHLCASDLNAVSSSPVPPHLLWMKELVWPKDWELESTHLLPLGSSKLCIASFFRTSDDEEAEAIWDYKPDTTNNFGVLTGVEVVSDEQGLRIVHHKSNRFDFGLSIASVL